MILLHDHHFSVAEYHKKIDSEQAGEDLAQGLILSLDVVFEDWLECQPVQAEAFLDPGADNTQISLRWIHRQAEASHPEDRTPTMDPAGLLQEKAEVLIGGHRLALGDPERPIWIRSQGDDAMPLLPEIPGLEDLLLGRDFITQHGLLILIDGDRHSLSILAPIDTENKNRRQHALAAFDRDVQFETDPEGGTSPADRR